jgi:hypothetical protein
MTKQGTDPGETERIYRELRKGLGHELVTEQNVKALIARAQQDGHGILAEELREWASGCGGPPASPLPGSPAEGGLH